eukprot:UN31918
MHDVKDDVNAKHWINFIIERVKDDSNLLNLSNKNNDKKLDDAYFKIICDALRESKCPFTSLNLDYNNLSDESIKNLYYSLFVNESTCSINSLHLAGNNFTVKSCEIIQKIIENNQNLHTLVLRNNVLTDTGVYQILQGLFEQKTKKNSAIVHLDLGDTGIESKSWCFLMKHLSLLENPYNISELNLDNARVNQSDLLPLAKMLRVNNKLTKLSIGKLGKSLDCEAVEWIAENLQGNNSLAHLNLSGGQIAGKGVES